MEIKEKVIDAIANQVSGLLNHHKEEISEAMLEGDDAVSLGIPIKIKRKGSRLAILINLNFVKNRVREGVDFVIDTEQQSLPIK